MSGAEFPCRGRRGFTLVEMLVVMTLLGLISVALFGGLRFGARVWESGDRRSAAFAEIEIAQSLLRRLLEQTVALSDPEDFSSFVGEEEWLRFTAPAPSQFNLGGIYVFELRGEEDEVHKKLVLRWQLYREETLEDAFENEAEEDSSVGGRRTLLRGVEEIRFSYFGTPEANDDDPRWYDVWVEAEQPPSFVSIKLGMAPEDPRSWPELQVAPRTVSSVVFQ